jgi:limonene-1,2-epoxide hydrolase
MPEVNLATIAYDAEVRHDGRMYKFTIPDLRIPVCAACGERVFTERVDDQINDALRVHLELLAPRQIDEAIACLGMSQKDICSPFFLLPFSFSSAYSSGR